MQGLRTVFCDGKCISVRVLEPYDFGAAGSMPDPALVLIHAGIAKELDAFGGKLLDNLLQVPDLPTENREFRGLVLRTDAHKPQVGTRLRAEAEHESEPFVGNEAKPECALIERTGCLGVGSRNKTGGNCVCERHAR
jgi:hypothetical protein